MSPQRQYEALQRRHNAEDARLAADYQRTSHHVRALRCKFARMAANEAAKADALWAMRRQRLESLSRGIAQIDRELTEHVLHVRIKREQEGKLGSSCTDTLGPAQQAAVVVPHLVGVLGPLQLKVYSTMRDVMRQLLEVSSARRELEAQVLQQWCQFFSRDASMGPQAADMEAQLATCSGEWCPTAATCCD